jgi:hypothetical protein
MKETKGICFVCSVVRLKRRYPRSTGIFATDLHGSETWILTGMKEKKGFVSCVPWFGLKEDNPDLFRVFGVFRG